MAKESVFPDQIAEVESFNDLEAETAKVSDLLRKVEALERQKSEPVKSNEEVVKWENEVLGLKSQEELVKKAGEDVKEELAKVPDMLKNVEPLERENGELVKLNEEVMKCEKEILGLKSEEELVKKVGEEGKALEVSVAICKGDLGNADVNDLDEEVCVGHIEEELMIEGLLVEIEVISKEKALVEAQVVELESKIKGIEEWKEAELSIKESEIILLMKKVDKLKAAINNGGLELSKEKVEKKTLEDALNISNLKVSELETKLIVLQKMLDEAEIAIGALKQTVVQAVNGMVDEGSNKRTINLKWTLGAGATVAFVGGIIGLHYARTR